jgi:ABC-type amino acid transport system permease subunit
MEVYTVVGIIFFVILSPLTLLARRIEQRQVGE